MPSGGFEPATHRLKAGYDQPFHYEGDKEIFTQTKKPSERFTQTAFDSDIAEESVQAKGQVDDVCGSDWRASSCER